MYHAGQPYRRGLVSPAGDRCSFIGFSHAIAAEAAADLDSRAADPLTYVFPFSFAPIDRTRHLLHQQVRTNAIGGELDGDAVRETLYAMVAEVVKAGYSAAGAQPARRSATIREHRDAVDSVRADIGRDLTMTSSLDELAATVHMSPFHLSRVFREQTGQSISAYRTDLRLRSSLEPIASGVGLASVAALTGFASHAHLSDRFRRAYGLTPQAWRSGLANPSEMRRIVEASGGQARIA
jgi:AraC-like DNA-binding protein